jgi:hypothetical protein
MTTTIQHSADLLTFLVAQADSSKNWFGFTNQRITAIVLAHDIARNHANTMTPDEVVDYACSLNQKIWDRIINHDPRIRKARWTDGRDVQN